MCRCCLCLCVWRPCSLLILWRVPSSIVSLSQSRSLLIVPLLLSSPCCLHRRSLSRTAERERVRAVNSLATADVSLTSPPRDGSNTAAEYDTRVSLVDQMDGGLLSAGGQDEFDDDDLGKLSPSLDDRNRSLFDRTPGQRPSSLLGSLDSQPIVHRVRFVERRACGVRRSCTSRRLLCSLSRLASVAWFRFLCSLVVLAQFASCVSCIRLRSAVFGCRFLLFVRLCLLASLSFGFSCCSPLFSFECISLLSLSPLSTTPSHTDIHVFPVRTHM
jgi:hypothetical protein